MSVPPATAPMPPQSRARTFVPDVPKFWLVAISRPGSTQNTLRSIGSLLLERCDLCR